MKPEMHTDEKICPGCTATIKVDARRCPYCGHTFTEIEIEAAGRGIQPGSDEQAVPMEAGFQELTPTEQAQPEQALAPEATPAERFTVPEYQPVIQDQPKSRNRTVWGWVILVIGVLLIITGVCIAIFMIYVSSNVSAPSGTEAYNFGYYGALGLLNCCIAPPEIIAGIILAIVGARWIRKGG
jgi:hypothetical protein